MVETKPAGDRGPNAVYEHARTAPAVRPHALPHPVPQPGHLRSFRAGLRFDLRHNRTLLAMMAPGILLLLLFSYLPMFGVVIAFQDYRPTLGVLHSQWVGFENFRFLFGTGDAWKLTFRTLAYNLAFLTVDQIGSIALALLLYEIKNRYWSRTYQTALFIPFFLSWVVVGYLTFAFLNTENGALNKFLEGLGLAPVRWFGSPQYWPVILVVVSFWKNIGLGTALYLAGIMGISPDYYEAAKIDGAGKWQQTRYITLPLLTPLILIIVLLALGRILRTDFGLFFNVTRDSSLLYITTDVLDTYVFRALRSQGAIAMAAAAGFYQSVVSFVLVVGANWLVRRIDPDKALF
jgi:putative aldouronate transport system permease protein